MDVAAVTALALVTGAGNSFVTNTVLDWPCAPGCDTTTFTKPIFVTLIAFVGMAASAVDVAVARCFAARWRAHGALAIDDALASASSSDAGADTRAGVTGAGARAGGAGSPPPAWPRCIGCARAAGARYAPLLVPALLDTGATLMQVAAALFISAGVNAALRGTLLLFTAVAARWLRVRDHAASAGEWAGIALAVAGVAAAGASAALDAAGAPPDANDPRAGVGAALAGIALATGSNAVQALQVAYETRFLEAAAFTPAEANAVEGVLGVAACAALLALAQALPPAARVEDTGGALCCATAAAPALPALLAGLCALFAASSAAHMRLSGLVGANFRAFVLVARAGLVWAAELSVFYAAGGARFGGAGWRRYSWLHAVGLGALGAGGAQLYAAQRRREARAAGDGGGDGRSDTGALGTALIGKDGGVDAPT